MDNYALLYQDRYLHLLDLINNRRLLIGFGRTSPWLVDLIPDGVPPYINIQHECFGYVTASARPVIRVEEETEDTITVAGEYFLPIAATLSALRQNHCRYLLFEGTLEHNAVSGDIPVAYRSIGLYRDAVLTPPNTLTTGFIPAENVTANLIYLRTFSPVAITPNTEDLVREVVRF